MERTAVLIEAPDGARLAGMAHAATGETGVLIVAGAPQTRVGPHRLFVTLADAAAADGAPALRFDRRGLGDSQETDPGFRAIGPDIAAARAALLRAFPRVRRVIGIGLCDGAAALALAPDLFDGLVLLNPWTRDSDRTGDLPPRAAIRARYRARLNPVKLISRVIRGDLNLRRAAQGLWSAATPEAIPQTARDMAKALAEWRGPVRIVLGERDVTGLVFQSLWQSPLFAAARRHPDRSLVTVAGAGHSFAGQAAMAALLAEVSAAVRSGGAQRS